MPLRLRYALTMRFLIALLIACLAMPALATPRCTPMQAMPMAHMQHGDHHPAPAQQPAMTEHACIGCIAPIDGMARLAAPAKAPRPDMQSARNDRALPRPRDCPATPPPKRLA